MFFDDLKSSKFLEKTKRVAFLFDTQIRNLQLKKKNHNRKYGGIYLPSLVW